MALGARLVRLLNARHVAHKTGGAEARHESRGAHAHEDFPKRDDKKWRVHTVARVDGNKVDLGYRPVITDPLSTEAEGGISLKKIAPKARTF